MVVSVLFVALFYSSFATSNVFAAMKSPRYGKADNNCGNNVADLTVTCCWQEVRFTGAEGSHGFELVWKCQSCNINTDTGDITNDCTEVVRTSGGSVFDTPGNLPNGTNVTKGGIFQPQQPAPPNSTVPSGGTFEEQQIPPSGPAIPRGGTFESGGTFNSLQPTPEGATGAPPPVDEAAPPAD